MAIDHERQEWNTRALEDSSLDVIISLSPTVVLLLTGYWPVMGNSIAVFTRAGEFSIILPEDELELAGKSSAARLVPYRPGSLTRLTTPPEEFTTPLCDLVRSLGATRARFGVERQQTEQAASYIASSRYHGDLRELLSTQFPDATCDSCDGLLAALQARKTRTELTIMRSACNIAARGFAAACRNIRAGATEREIAAAAYAAFEGTPYSAPVTRSYGFFYCMSGPNSAKASAAFAQTRTRTIGSDDLVMLHANTCADGYWTDITRTWTAGTPTVRHEEMRRAIANARDAALAAIRPGARAADVDRAAREVMTTHGFGEAFRHSTGHGVGFAAANANGRPRIHPASPDILEEGMTFNIEPAAYFDGYGGMRHCDVVAVTANGAEVLTEF